MEAGLMSGDTILTCPGSFKLGDHVFWCDNHVAHGSINVTTALQVSCDVFFYQVALMAGIDRIADMAGRLGLGVPLGADLPHVATGLVPTLDWAKSKGIHHGCAHLHRQRHWAACRKTRGRGAATRLRPW
jgi:penicillin-binding protein 2